MKISIKEIESLNNKYKFLKKDPIFVKLMHTIQQEIPKEEVSDFYIGMITALEIMTRAIYISPNFTVFKDILSAYCASIIDEYQRIRPSIDTLYSLPKWEGDDNENFDL